MKKITVLVLFFWSQLGFCEDAAAILQTKLNAIRTMSASFKQVIKAKKRQLSHSSGTMALARPGRFRWQTKDPMPQLVVADGKRLWIYDEDLEQVTVKKQDKGLGGTAALFLSGYDDTVSRDFTVTQSTKGKKEYFDLQAKSGKANFQRVKLVFEGATLSAMELFDQLGQHTHVQLSNIKINPSLGSTVFKFKIPKGVDVVEQ
ncbi:MULTISPECIES: outer membrane lipoprotein chaperone LolA [Legionella]|uniref:Outer-membrane lipoprotein carrier protein n=1 Tax=Legionella septentrionalis TaxID=2498109 RepID=A0A433JKB1_9GAMM|nr:MULTISPECIES: outer membrane lipoprotein chaperone LolA [Legionella]MCP0914292.1 outer membrane lipoprotein chaperone LolA [Legionella sp. 27cVA30]RUQ89046.1 outer membrane lipoprotein carrier protein LolA [Legionella septentrionalis]RUR00623.1 outer membrane lipoprotein carrier protein LolA [Legionella septentrionalis]RUR11790.1 outer membrane lipoprotein carrier protein LolA [Legionella septentrionalis]RUR17478.1 outer membrane lipoprotein carrier protein LolA [Legionella septentrionalis]